MYNRVSLLRSKVDKFSRSAIILLNEIFENYAFLSLSLFFNEKEHGLKLESYTSERRSILLFDYSESFFHGYPIFIARPRDRIKDARGKYIPSSPSSKLAKVAVLVFFFAPRRVVCRPLDMKRAMEARKLRTSPSPPPPPSTRAPLTFVRIQRVLDELGKGGFRSPPP